ncbi:MAG: PQQ-dependent dehydrogenase, methanol/ethanol family, partial [Thiotrichales bacterium]|nr:PQQ-dependent dehydrogenase, methanol/ethanol family [Thiotrichales bacterium]
MSKLSFKSALLAAVALMVPVTASANDEVRALTQNPNYWAFPGGNYWNWRYTELKQINTGNANKVVAAWTFSTGRLQGH